MRASRKSSGEDCTDKNWIELHRHFSKNWLQRADRSWETIKLNTILCSALISLAIYSIVYVYTSEFFWETEAFPSSGKVVIRLALVLIPITMCFVDWRLHSNFNRQCRRMYTLASIIMKIEERLGLYSEYREREHFSDDRWYVPNDWQIYQNYTSDYYVQYWMNEPDSFYKNMTWLFQIFGLTAVGLMILDIVLLCL